MATTALSDDEKERTISSLPFIPCNARLPIIILIASSFFEDHKAIFAIGLYILCIIVTFISIIISKKGNEDVSPLIMELPKYRPPSLTNLIREVKNKLKDFFVRAGTVVFLSCVVVNLLAMLTPDFHLTENCEESILFYLGNGFAPIFSPLGFGDGRIITALASGFFAKESIVSVIQILIPNGLSSALSEAGAFSLAVFSLLYIPCLSTLSVVRRELGIKNAVLILFRTFLFAIMISYISYTAFSFLSK
jgi:ferrous iron transport protein B